MSMAIIFFYFRMLRILWPGDVAIRTALAGCGRGDCGYPDDSAGYLGILNILE